MTEQGYPPRQPEYPDRQARRGGGRDSRRTGWQLLDDFDGADDAESDLPPWAVPGGIAPSRAARRGHRQPERPADGRDWPTDRLGGPSASRRGTAGPRPARRGPDPYGDPRDYEEPPGYSRPPGYDAPRDYRSRGHERPYPDQGRGYDEYGDYGQPGSYDEPDDYREPGAPEPGSVPGRPGAEDPEGEQPPGRLRRPGRTRAAAARRRRSKRRLVTWGGAAVIIAALVAGGLYLTRSPGKKTHHYVTTLQNGELRTVPSACKVLSAATLHQVMAGTPRAQPVGGGQGQSECTFTIDAKPAFRILQIQEQAYQPSLAVPSGNGSATANAAWNFSQARYQLTKPPKHSVWPAARFSALSGLGDQAVSTAQASRGQVVTDRVTVLVRYRNVLIQVQAQAQENGGFGPVPVADLRSAALIAARGTFAALKREPTG